MLITGVKDDHMPRGGDSGRFLIKKIKTYTEFQKDHQHLSSVGYLFDFEKWEFGAKVP